jgi:hypothetical protein
MLAVRGALQEAGSRDFPSSGAEETIHHLKKKLLFFVN